MNYYNYFTEIEEHFVRRRGKHLLISPMDWCLIATWRDAGVPLQVAIRGIDIAMDRFFARPRRVSSRVNSLCYCHDSVMAEYASYLESHVGDASGDPQALPNACEADIERKNEPGKTEVLEFISARIDEIKGLSAKHYFHGSALEGIHRVLARLEAIGHNVETGSQVELEALERDLKIIDEILMAELRPMIPTERIAEWEKEAKKELKVYRKRLPKETFDKIRANYMRGKIRQWFHIDELSLFRL